MKAVCDFKIFLFVFFTQFFVPSHDEMFMRNYIEASKDCWSLFARTLRQFIAIHKNMKNNV
ncbi:CLUMA_CG007874, isoform A [Clunio marinus]|uniref:CLUMA_CG007874, isoform A n=1 Tax=Clunio marinus TaxID=568069 RepID=A0A1J1I210_9DIPT|nr:CLUMA_CG007874, isoform A [Clunio marinus]